MQKLTQYIISFLLGENAHEQAISSVGYTTNPAEFARYKVVIFPSGFFDAGHYDTPASLPPAHLSKIDGTPLLYGNLKEEIVGNTLVLYADFIASAFFLLSRYEEWLQPNLRDRHGRFTGKDSTAYKAGVVQRPIVDEYGAILRSCLRRQGVEIAEPPAKIAKVYLTHDVDIPFFFRNLRHVASSFFRALIHRNKLPRIGGSMLIGMFKSFFGRITDDPAFSFPWIFKQNKTFQETAKMPTQSILFVKATTRKYARQDKPVYKLKSKDIKYLLNLAQNWGAQIGLHASYLSGDKPELVNMEKEILEKNIAKKIRSNRYHFLHTKNPADMQVLIDAGISNDFTLGYADTAGFRLGTCRPVRWINPENKQVSKLILHPLTVMDVSLSEKKYMNLTYENAISCVKNLAEQVAKHNGELVLLWHNTSFIDNLEFDHKTLYTNMLSHIKTLSYE
ncbi:MAG: polysaccharide deacetylase family protein [Prevotellaceae bacterium]|jgi:hypothetical protein|nr:polysaccharide deacetylase family protein [Prevotellaceae bacterium]